jgi:DNA-binding response OmpR family regulator
MRILVVEDSPTAALALRRRLEEMGLTVIVAKNGREGWEHLQKQHEWVVITDWMMPEMDGPELCRRIRARKDALYTYVIIMTVKDLRKDRLEGLKAGADDFLTKPPDVIELATALETARRITTAMAELHHRVTELEAASEKPEQANPEPAEMPTLSLLRNADEITSRFGC